MRQQYTDSRRASFALVAAIAGFGAMGAVTLQNLAQAKSQVTAKGQAADLPIGKPAPELTGGSWLNGKPTTLAAQKGKVVVLAFWTHGCINCKRTLPFWNDWARRYSGTDVTVLSVHTPELEFERNLSNVRQFIKENRLSFPVLPDNEYKAWRAFDVQAWPTTILIDKEGKIRRTWEGELDWQSSGEYKRVEQAIETLRKEKE